MYVVFAVRGHLDAITVYTMTKELALQTLYGLLGRGEHGHEKWTPKSIVLYRQLCAYM